MQIDLSGRVALVTGGSQGLGFAIARRLSAAGADVSLVARDRARLEAARSELEPEARGRIMIAAGDVSRADDVARIHAETLKGFGRIDILVNNAGTSNRAPFIETTDEMWQQDLDLKLMAAVRLSRLVWEQMKDRRWGRIINVLSVNAKAPAGGGAPTAVSRAAGMALTKVLSLEGAPHNILVNAALVGSFVTEQARRRHAADPRGLSFEQYLEPLHRRIPLGRLGDPDEFARVVCFFASDAGSYLTGTALNVDGGLSPVV